MTTKAVGYSVSITTAKKRSDYIEGYLTKEQALKLAMKLATTSNKIESPLKITRDIVSNESMYRSDFLVLAGVYSFYDDEDGDRDNSQKIVSFLNTGSVREGD